MLVCCIVLSWQPLDGTSDLWANAAIGRWIVEHHEVPHHTLFLWTTEKPYLPQPVNWVAHHWLGDVLFYGLLSRGDEEAGGRWVMWFTLLTIAAPFLMLWRTWSRRGPITLLTLFFFALAVHLSTPRFMPRPEIFTALFLAMLLQWLIDWGEPKPPRFPWRIIATASLFAAWANFHGAVLIGLVLIAATALSELAQGRSRTLAVAAVVAIGAIFVNPYGLAYLGAFKAVGSYTFNTIAEWQPVWKPPDIGLEVKLEATGLGMVSLVAWLLNPRRRWSHLLWLMIMGYAFLSARRNVWLFCLTCLAVLAANAAALNWGVLCERWRLQGYERTPVRMLLHWSPRLAGILLIWVWFRPHLDLPLRPLTENIPHGMATYFETHPRPAHLFNDYDNSPYFEWRFGERLPLFIDLVNAYPDSITKAYDDIRHATEKGYDRFVGLGIDCVMIRRPEGKWPPLASILDRMSGWEAVYTGPDGRIWRKRATQSGARANL